MNSKFCFKTMVIILLLLGIFSTSVLADINCIKAPIKLTVEGQSPASGDLNGDRFCFTMGKRIIVVNPVTPAVYAYQVDGDIVRAPKKLTVEGQSPASGDPNGNRFCFLMDNRIIVVNTASPAVYAHQVDASNAIDFTLKDVDGKTVSLSDYRGKRVWVNFWATWCGFCVQEMPDMQSVKTECGNDLVILAVNSTEDAKTAKDFITSKGYNFVNLMDPDRALLDRFNIEGFPTSIFINRSGVISDTYLGSMTKKQMQDAVKKIN